MQRRILDALFAAIVSQAVPAPLAGQVKPEKVTIDFIVRDKKGGLFRGLQAGDLAITDDGLPAQISGLRLLSPGGPSEFSIGRTQVQTIALLFDAAMSESRRARAAAGDILRLAAPGTWFAVYHSGERLSIVQPYTQDRPSVVAAIAKATFRPKRRAPRRQASAQSNSAPAEDTLYTMPPEGSEAGRLARISLETAVDSATVAAAENSRSPVAGLLALARTHSRFDGRKAAILFSDSLRITTRLQWLLRDTIATSNRANLSVFIFDTSELSQAARRSAAGMYGVPVAAGMTFQAAGGSLRTSGSPVTIQPSGGPGSLMGAPQMKFESAGLNTPETLDRLQFMERNAGLGGQSPMRDLADRTGGFYVSDLLDSRKPVRRVLESLETRYQVDFVSTASDYDGRLRPLAITLKKQSLRAHGPTGYVALPPGATPETRPFEFPLLKALSADPLPRDLTFRSGMLRAGRSVAAIVEIPFSTLHGIEDGSSRLFTAHFSVLARVRGAAGEAVQSFSQDVPYRVALERRPKAETAVFTFYRQFPLPPGDYIFESAVFDQQGRRAGATRTPLHVDPAPDGPALSDVALVRGLEPLPPESRDDRNLFRYNDSKVIPDLGRSFSAAAGKPLRFFATVEPLPGGQPDISVQVLRGGAVQAELPLQLAANPAGGPVPLLFALPADTLSPGVYDVRVRAAQAGKMTENRVSVEVQGDPAQAAGPAPRRPEILAVSETMQAPDAADRERMLGGMRERALEYSEKLPNFGCVVLTRRWFDRSGRENWRAKDNYAEVVRVVNNDEEHRVVEVNGRPSTKEPKGLNSSGEFGALLKMALDPKFHPQVEWKEWTLLGDRLLHVFSYRVEPRYSSLHLRGEFLAGAPRAPGYHGLLYVDPDTLSVRRLTVAADLPQKSGPKEVAITVDYDYVALGERDHVLPVEAEVRVRTARGTLLMNQLEFRDCRRFSAQSAIRFEER